ncbi:C1 family peptidase [Kosmotoga sp. DU53]|uniref:C1 family peptidase n=1 Tax=Kosmotoga sp. DU53 TaxID=1310160 RepID=UPI0007C4E7C7|nr:C1 family peptidase [Kosmotoga sp. DU53]OAA21453.1 hypothetical protein DU53_05995 [Kosmotoga sp. DU53]
MKKILIVIAVLLMVSLLAAGPLLDAANEKLVEIKDRIENLGFSWYAGLPGNLEKYEELGITDLNALFEKWNGYRELPDKLKTDLRNYYFNNALTTKYSQLLSTGFLYFPVGDVTIPATSFIQIHTPIRDQGYHGTCWAFSTVASFESALMVQKDGLSGGVAVDPRDFALDDYDLSEQFVAYHDLDWDVFIESLYNESDPIIQDSNYDAGGNTFFSFYNNIRYGIPLETDLPYSAYDLKPWIQWNPSNSEWKGNLIRSTKSIEIWPGDELAWMGTPYTTYINAIKEALVKFGALSVSYLVPYSFSYYSEGIYMPVPGFDEIIGFTGGHAVTLVGWLDMEGVKELGWVSPDATCVEVNDPYSGITWQATEFWVIKNSWAANWGWNGYYVVPMVSEELYNLAAEYKDYTIITPWMIEYRSMRVPLFEEAYALNEDIDFNGDGVVDEADYQLLIENLYTYSSTYDISVPKDGYVDQEDVTRFLMIWNDIH